MNRGIALQWQASESRGQVKYQVIRKARAQPHAVGDGTLIAETSLTSLADTQAVPGEHYHYAVYTKRGGAVSAIASVAGPVMCVADVNELTAIGGDGLVTLNWQPPERATAIEVWRKEIEPPEGRNDGISLNTVTLNSAADSGLQNGSWYGYRAIAVFDGIDGRPVRSTGATVKAIPTQPPKPIIDLSVARAKQDLIISWNPPEVGQAALRV